ncbi:MAG: hypothetical protein HGA71_15520 [Azonexaceae bacterium]|nr:hypothetical protein [Azonexaceae bacterium]
MTRIQINAKVDTGITATGTDGRPLTLALLDADGRVVAAGDELTTAIYRTVIDAQNAFWIGNGQMTVIRPLVTAD